MITFRTAVREDLPTLVAMLADDELGQQRERLEDPLPSPYHDAFDVITRDANHDLIVAERDGTIAAFLQLTFLPCLTHVGRWRALIEGVRVSSAFRGIGVGTALIEEAITRAHTRECHLVQLTTDKTRPDAIRFYERLGFEATHEGMKRRLK